PDEGQAIPRLKTSRPCLLPPIYSTREKLTQTGSASDRTVRSLALPACVTPTRVEDKIPGGPRADIRGELSGAHPDGRDAHDGKGGRGPVEGTGRRQGGGGDAAVLQDGAGAVR